MLVSLVNETRSTTLLFSGSGELVSDVFLCYI